METNIYLDVDGVLLANEKYAAEYAPQFIKFVLSNYPDTSYWLTTRCKGSTNQVLDQLEPLFDEKTHNLLKLLKPTIWDRAKTEAIDFTKPFLWFDDDLFIEERVELIEHNVLDNYIKVDLQKNENQLADFLRSFPLPINI
jgi:hypothetical protein